MIMSCFITMVYDMIMMCFITMVYDMIMMVQIMMSRLNDPDPTTSPQICFHFHAGIFSNYLIHNCMSKNILHGAI